MRNAFLALATSSKVVGYNKNILILINGNLMKIRTLPLNSHFALEIAHQGVALHI
jgi:hypothetical protein